MEAIQQTVRDSAGGRKARAGDLHAASAARGGACGCRWPIRVPRRAAVRRWASRCRPVVAPRRRRRLRPRRFRPMPCRRRRLPSARSRRTLHRRRPSRDGKAGRGRGNATQKPSLDPKEKIGPVDEENRAAEPARRQEQRGLDRSGSTMPAIEPAPGARTSDGSAPLFVASRHDALARSQQSIRRFGIGSEPPRCVPRVFD